MSYVTPKANVVPQGKIPETSLPTWTFLSNHAHVLLLIARDPEIKLRDVAWRVGITERAVQRIVADLEAAKYLERTRKGRRNQYRIHLEVPLRHPIEAHTEIGALLNLILNRNGAAIAAAHEKPVPRKRAKN